MLADPQEIERALPVWADHDTGADLPYGRGLLIHGYFEPKTLQRESGGQSAQTRPHNQHPPLFHRFVLLPGLSTAGRAVRKLLLLSRPSRLVEVRPAE